MKMERPYKKVHITPKGEAALVKGHPWVYAGEVTEVEDGVTDGGLVDVVSRKGSYLGTAFYNSHSTIRCRLVSRNANDTFDAAFWQRRAAYAWAYRKTVLAEEDLLCCRVIFGEADFFPGLTVDRFGTVLVAQVLSLGMALRQDVIFPALVQVLRQDGQQIDGVYLRNDVALRDKEGLAQGKGWYPLPGEAAPDYETVSITENGIAYTVDFVNGQKTGFFLDQKYNRRAVARLAKGHTVLDCFTHTGSFALHAAKYGAAEVTGVDISEFACECARENAALNGFHNVSFVAANAFDYLKEQCSAGEQYDVVILDPPAFTKTRAAVEAAARGYKEINLRGMKLLKDGGYLITCSCSQHMLPGQFKDVVLSAARDAHVSLFQVEYRTQGRDHPILPAAPETQYLKCGIFRVDK